MKCFRSLTPFILLVSLTGLAGCAGGYATPPPLTMASALSSNLSTGERTTMMSVLPSVPSSYWAHTVYIQNGVVYGSSHELEASMTQYTRAAANAAFQDSSGNTVAFPADDFNSPANFRTSNEKTRDSFSFDEQQTGDFIAEYSPLGYQNLTTYVSIPCDSTSIWDGTKANPAQTAYVYSGGLDSTAAAAVKAESGLDVGLQINSDHEPDSDGFAGVGTIQAFVTGPSLSGTKQYSSTAFAIPLNSDNFSCGDGGTSTSINGGVYVDTTAISLTLYPSGTNQLTMLYSQASTQTTLLAMVISFNSSAGWSPLGCSGCQVKRVTALAVPAGTGDDRPGTYFGVSAPKTPKIATPQVAYTNTAMAPITGCLLPIVQGPVITGGPCTNFAASGGGYAPANGLTNGVLQTSAPLGSPTINIGIDEYTTFSAK